MGHVLHPAMDLIRIGYSVEGDPTEGALIVSAMKAGLSMEKLKAEFPQIDALPFESARQYMATLHDQGPGKPRLVYVKGSIESLCVDCSIIYTADGGMDTADPDQIHRRVEDMAHQGLRVLAFSRMEMPPETECRRKPSASPMKTWKKASSLSGSRG